MASVDITYKTTEPKGISTPQKQGLLGDSADSISSKPPKYEDIASADYVPVAKIGNRRSRNSESRPETHIEIDSGNVACAMDYGQEDDPPSDDLNIFSSFIKVHSSLSRFYKSKKSKISMILYAILGMAYLAYFVAALVLCSEGDLRDPIPLVVLTAVVVGILFLWFVNEKFGENINATVIKPMKNILKDKRRAVNVSKVIVMVLVVIAVAVIIGTSIWARPSNAISLAGIAFFLITMLLCSAHPTKVKWRPVIGGLLLQFFFASLILKLSVGYTVFKFLGDNIQTFLSFTNNGTQFVFGEKYTDHFFAMKILPVIVFFSCAISVMYYLGIMQIVISKIAWLMRVTLGTTAAESLCAAGNIFIGQTEAPILIRPYLDLMTKPELHSIATCGFATIAGGVLAAYIEFGVPAEHLLCASVMNAPAALAVSKLLYPETEQSKLTKLPSNQSETRNDSIEEAVESEPLVETSTPKEKNIIEAAAGGASASIKLVANIAVNLIAFLAMLAFVNAVLGWFGSFVGQPNFSFQMVCGYVLMPVSYLMGVDWDDAGVVGELIGIKTFLNEFIAYSDLSAYIKNRENCEDGTILSMRSEVIATYALCGFANLGSVGVMLGALGPMAPRRKGDLATVVMRALLGGIVTCLLTASVAGLLVTDFADPPSCLLNVTSSNVTAMLTTNITGMEMLDPLSVVCNTTASVL